MKTDLFGILDRALEPQSLQLESTNAVIAALTKNKPWDGASMKSDTENRERTLSMSKKRRLTDAFTAEAQTTLSEGNTEFLTDPKQS